MSSVFLVDNFVHGSFYSNKFTLYMCFVCSLPATASCFTFWETSKTKFLLLARFEGRIISFSFFFLFFFFFLVTLKIIINSDVQTKHQPHLQKMMDVHGGIKNHKFWAILKGVRENFRKIRPQANGRQLTFSFRSC